MPPEPIAILAVDDVPENLAALDALLTGDGVELVKAATGAEALELLLQRDFAVALLDVQMPAMDGFELAELMRGTERTKRIPIVFLTAVATDDRRKFRGYETGAVDYLLKPVDAQVLRNKVGVFVELYRQRIEIARQRDEMSDALARLQAHSDNSPLAIVELDGGKNICGWSNGAERLFGWDAPQVLGRAPGSFDWIAPEDAERFAELIASMSVLGPRREMLPLRMFAAQGEALDCECYCSALFDSTGQLSSVNIQILDVSARKRSEDTQRLLIGELNHRVKNTLATVQAITSQTLRNTNDPAEFAPTFIGRIHSLAAAHSLLSSSTWQGARLRELVEGQLRIGAIAEGQLAIEGPDLELNPEPALHLALVLHELVTNAHKYGALSVTEGKVAIRWQVADQRLYIQWVESGGPAVAPPDRRGFGTTLIERSLHAEGGLAALEYPIEGLRCELSLPFDKGPEDTMAGAPMPLAGDMPINDVENGSLAGRKFLIVEDEPLVALELFDLLTGAGAIISGQASNKAHALQLAQEADADAALLDGNLQGEMVDEIAATLTERGIPFLFVSGYGREHLPVEYGCIKVVSKPFTQKELLSHAAALVGSGSEAKVRCVDF